MDVVFLHLEPRCGFAGLGGAVPPVGVGAEGLWGVGFEPGAPDDASAVVNLGGVFCYFYEPGK